MSANLQYSFAKERGVIHLNGAEEGAEAARVGLREGADPMALIEVRRVLGRRLQVEPMARADFERRLAEVYAGEGIGSVDMAQELDLAGGLDAIVDDLPQAADLLDTADDAPVIRLINALIAEAVRKGASDIHVEPYESALLVRFRVDGVLRETLSLPARVAPLFVSRVKVMARLDIAERRIPQDGRIGLALGGKTVDVRVSTLPSRHGERVVLRILDKEQANLGLEDLGMSPSVLGTFRQALREPNGIILVTGPTGSGKTTTLYAGLAMLNDRSRNILTVEDPIEYAFEGIGQTQVNTKVGMTFATGLRAILRQDPDVVMVGEIRDVETAQIAIQASLTGHLVLSTVHTNDAVGAITRLRDMGLEPFLLASTLRVIVAQRLVRRLCPHCRSVEPADAGEARAMGVAPATPIHHARGCAQCNHTGYTGRVGIYEAVKIDDRIRRLIHENADEAAITRVAFAAAPQLGASARALVLSGVTTVEEAIRVTRAQESADLGGV